MNEGSIEFRHSLLAGYEQAHRRTMLLRVALGLGVPVAGLVIWELLSRLGLIDSYFFPAPSTIARNLIALLGKTSALHLIGSDLQRTLTDTLIGFGIGAFAGILIGVMMGSWKVVDYLLGPTFYATYSLPKVTLFPIFIILFGLGRSNTILLCALGTFYIVCIPTIAGVRGSAAIYAEVTCVFRVPRRLRYSRVTLRAAWPSIANGLRLGMGGALVLVLVLEFIGSTSGMGAFIWNAWQQGSVGDMFLGLLVVAVVGGAFFVIGEQLERWSSPARQMR